MNDAGRSAMAEGRALRARVPDALMRLGVRHPGRVLAVWLLVCVAAVPGITRLRVDTSTDSVLDRRHPAWQIYQASQDRFGGDEIIVVALTGERPFDPRVLRKIRQLSDQIEGLEGVRRVDSVATVPVVHVDEAGDLELFAPLERAPEESAALSRHVESRLAHDRIAPRSLVSSDGRTFAINVVLDRGLEARHASLLDALHALVDPAQGILSGVPVFRVAANVRTSEEILLYAPLTGLLIVAFLIAIFRSAWAVVLGAVPGIVGSWLFLAAMGYTGAPLSITTMVLPTIILALGCAYSMHLLAAASSPGSVVGRDADRSRALEKVLEAVTLPVALSGLTTVVGFVSITAVRIDAVRSTGGYGALGVLVVTAAVLTLLPAGLSWRPLPSATPRGFRWTRERLAPSLVAGVKRRHGMTLMLWTAITLLAAGGLTRLEVETDATRWLPLGHPVRDSYESIRSALSGISPVNVVVEAPDSRSVLEPATLRAIDGLAGHLESQPEVGRALSIADPLRQLHGGFEADPSQPLPGSRALAEQYLLLLESLEQLDDLVDGTRSAANVVLRADDNSSARLVRIADQASAWWATNGPSDHTVVTTGIMYEFARAEDEIAYGQLRGLSIALAVISALLFAIFRWPRLALVSLIPNVIPLVLIFGAMGLFGAPLDAGTVLIGTLALGVAVDDTIHIATGYYQRVLAGASADAALLHTFEVVLPPIVCSTAMIFAAFCVLGLSEFTITRNLGLLTAGIMLLCLLADATLLAALLVRLPERALRTTVPNGSSGSAT
jgi:predicted RND superfamily exporter protein